MTQPTFCAIMLTKDRPEMTKRAFWCFESQTQAHRLLILDTGEKQFFSDHCREVISRTRAVYAPELRGRSIGWLRNHANQLAVEYFNPDVLIHFDSDDHSHPNRIAEQVALLQASGADAVGYREMLFWRQTGTIESEDFLTGAKSSEPMGEAWLYRNNDPRYMLGTSLCYWRKTWEQRPFPDKNIGEDKTWMLGIEKRLGVSSLFSMGGSSMPHPDPNQFQPRMIARVNPSNPSYDAIGNSPNSWTRVPGWDSFCRERMAL